MSIQAAKNKGEWLCIHRIFDSYLTISGSLSLFLGVHIPIWCCLLLHTTFLPTTLCAIVKYIIFVYVIYILLYTITFKII
jgi:hypothetical protein